MVRREWRSLALALGATAAISAVSFAIAPSAWFDWVKFLVSSSSTGPQVNDWYQCLMPPLWLRLAAAAALLVVWGRPNRSALGGAGGDGDRHARPLDHRAGRCSWRCRASAAQAAVRRCRGGCRPSPARPAVESESRSASTDPSLQIGSARVPHLDRPARLAHRRES